MGGASGWERYEFGRRLADKGKHKILEMNYRGFLVDTGIVVG